MLDFHALSESKRYLDVNAEVANGALDLGMAEQDCAARRLPVCLSMMDDGNSVKRTFILRTYKRP
jgi:hypothetical protein